MKENLDWFNRVYEALGNEDSYVEDWGIEFGDALDDELIAFKKRMGNRHPIIELFDTDEEERIAHICFDPFNQQFYMPSLPGEDKNNIHVLLDSFEDIQMIFCAAWQHSFSGISGIDDDDDDEFEFPDDEMDFLGHFNSFEDNVSNPFLAAYLLEQQQDESMMKEKLDSIEWIEEEKIVSSIKIDIPVSMEKLTLLRIGIIPSTNQRVLCKETRFLHDGDVNHSASQVFIIDEQELLLMSEMIQNHLN